MTETNAQLLKRFVDEGNRILVVGGALNQFLPERMLTHPKIVIWDDQKQGIENRTVPISTKAILWTALVSHKTTDRLNQAARSLHAIKFPNLKVKELKELLSEICPEPIQETSQEISQPIQPTQMPSMSKAAREPLKHGVLKRFIEENISKNTDWNRLGSMKAEANRLLLIAAMSGISTTESSMAQSVRLYVKALKESKTKDTPVDPEKFKVTYVPPIVVEPTQTQIQVSTPTPASIPSKKDDFETLDELIHDAITSLRLIQEHMPKVREETDRLRGLRDQLRKMLE